ncbi:MAG: hypothetical protein ABJH07_07140 [Sedimentitalea sp.]|uniref:hypothetical protein n=1 Tax=Sedimentitalea sp. TaxID=2048915 RepID=UPI0032679890
MKNRQDKALRGDASQSSEINTTLLCWTRMQTEAGQSLDKIIRRKNLEREGNGGLFFWGVGNPPAQATRSIATLRNSIKVVFSKMKSKPKKADTEPSQTFVWRRYIDIYGVERILPEATLVTSRGSQHGKPKRAHYALMCHSESSLRLVAGKPFVPSNYRNFTPTAGQVGNSQVTALLQMVANGTEPEGYYEDMTANLTGSFWVKLCDPRRLDQDEIDECNLFDSDCLNNWSELVTRLRQGPTVDFSQNDGQKTLAF